MAVAARVGSMHHRVQRWLKPVMRRGLPSPYSETLSHDIVARSRATWQQVVDEMVAGGAEGSDEELQLVVDYLTEHFGPR